MNRLLTVDATKAQQEEETTLTIIRTALVIASTREGRLAPAIGEWVARQAAARPELAIDVVDLDQFEIPSRYPADPSATCRPLLDRFAAAAAFVIVTPEYNHSFPGTLKQAIDLASDEFRAKPVAFVTYGGISSGLRAAEQLRPIMSALGAATISDTVSFTKPWDSLDPDGTLIEPQGAQAAANTMLDQLVWWARTLGSACTNGDLIGRHALFVTHRAKPGRRDDMLAVWDQYLRPLAEANPDHLAYFYCFDDADADVVRVFQLYRSESAARQFLEQPEYADYLNHVLPLVAEPPQLESATTIWTKNGS